MKLWLIFSLLTYLPSLILSMPGDPPPLSMRGHHQPFGRHAHQWVRVQTTYNEGNPGPREFYKNWVKPSLPLVMRGAIKDSLSVKRWGNLTYLAELAGDQPFWIAIRGLFPYDSHHVLSTTMPMSEYIQRFDKEPLYLDSPITPELQRELEWPNCVNCDEFPRSCKTPALFFNHGKSNSDIHIDGVETLFMQITNSRLWVMTPPDDVDNLYGGRFPHHSGVVEVNQRDVDLEKFPNVSRSTIYAAMVHPGDIIYVPEAWYHNVIASGSPNIAVTVFFDLTKCQDRFRSLKDYNYVPACMKYKKEKLPDEISCKKPIAKASSYYDVFTEYASENAQLAINFETTADMLRKSIRTHRKILNSGHKLGRIGYSVTGMSAEALEKGEILSKALDIGHWVFLTSPGDGSEEALAKAIEQSKTKREDLFIIATIPPEMFGKESARKSIEQSLKNLNTDYIDLVLMRAPYASREHDSPNGFDRFIFTDQWLETWRVMVTFQMEKKILSLGVQDFSIQEVKHLILEKGNGNISVIYGRFDPLYRNKHLRVLAVKNRIQFMAHSTNGDKWVEEGYYKVNPLILNENIQIEAFSSGISIPSLMYIWAIRRKAVVITPPTDKHMMLRLDLASFNGALGEDTTGISKTIDNLMVDDIPQKKL